MPKPINGSLKKLITGGIMTILTTFIIIFVAWASSGITETKGDIKGLKEKDCSTDTKIDTIEKYRDEQHKDISDMFASLDAKMDKVIDYVIDRKDKKEDPDKK